jgi:hypothetical protein
MIPRCPVTVTWYETGVTVRCVRPDNHDGPHRDGVWWFDDWGLRVDGTEVEEARRHCA